MTLYACLILAVAVGVGSQFPQAPIFHRFLRPLRIVAGLAFSLVLLCGGISIAHAKSHEHVNHECPRNKKNPAGICPGHKPPSAKNNLTAKGGVETIGCGCQSPWDQLMCFAGW